MFLVLADFVYWPITCTPRDCSPLRSMTIRVVYVSERKPVLKFDLCVSQSLTVLEFLVANGAERIIDELREHAYQVQVGGRISRSVLRVKLHLISEICSSSDDALVSRPSFNLTCMWCCDLIV